MNDEAEIFWRAKRLANTAIWTVDLQVKRISRREPEDEDFIMRDWADLQFLIVSLNRLRRTAFLASKVKCISKSMKKAIQDFDKAMPDLINMRNVYEHIDGYALGKGFNKSISPSSLEVVAISEDSLEWLGYKLNLKDVMEESSKLFQTIKENEAVVIENSKDKES